MSVAVEEYNRLHIRLLFYRLRQGLQLRDDTLHVPNRNNPLVHLNRFDFIRGKLLLCIISQPRRDLLQITGFRRRVSALFFLFSPLGNIQKRDQI